MEADYKKIKAHPLFEPIKKLFEFVIFGNGFMAVSDFQKALIICG